MLGGAALLEVRLVVCLSGSMWTLDYFYRLTISLQLVIIHRQSSGIFRNWCSSWLLVDPQINITTLSWPMRRNPYVVRYTGPPKHV
jgi:hypothetical protein